VTGDTLHTQRGHARFLAETKKARYAFTVKRNQKNLYEQMRTLPWPQATAKYYDRKETRVVQVLTVTGLGIDFPHAAQVDRVVRHRTDTRTGRQSLETVYVVTDLTSRQASAPDTGRRPWPPSAASSAQPCPAACPRSHSASNTDNALSQLLIPLPRVVCRARTRLPTADVNAGLGRPRRGRPAHRGNPSAARRGLGKATDSRPGGQ
jgi:hypothetical protein